LHVVSLKFVCRYVGFVARDCLFGIRKGKSPQAVRMRDRGELVIEVEFPFEIRSTCELWHVMA
jgi:hypothetical protein